MIGRPKPAVSWLEQLEQYRASQRLTAPSAVSEPSIDDPVVEALPAATEETVSDLELAIDRDELLDGTFLSSDAESDAGEDSKSQIDSQTEVECETHTPFPSIESAMETIAEMQTAALPCNTDVGLPDLAEIEALLPAPEPEPEVEIVDSPVEAESEEIAESRDAIIELKVVVPPSHETPEEESVDDSLVGVGSNSLLESLTLHIPLDPLSHSMKNKKPFVLGLCAVGDIQSVEFEQVARSIALRCSAKFGRKTCMVLITDALTDNSLLVDFSTNSLTEQRWRYIGECSVQGANRTSQNGSAEARMRKQWNVDIAKLPGLKQRYDLVVLAMRSASGEAYERVGRLCHGSMLLLANGLEDRRSIKRVRCIQDSGIRVLGCWSIAKRHLQKTG